jgi:hypothetical protein
MPPGILYVVVAAAGALALGVGAVALIDGKSLGALLALGGTVILFWSVRAARRG